MIEHTYHMPIYARRHGGGHMRITRAVDPVRTRTRACVRGTVESFCKEWEIVGAEIDISTEAGFADAAAEVPDDVDLLVPWTDVRLPIAPGSNPVDMTNRVRTAVIASHPVPGAERRSFPFCAVRRGTEGVANPWRAGTVWGHANGSQDYFDDSAVDVAARIAGRWPNRRQVVFLHREFPICGATLVAVNLCNRLVDRGWDATVAYTRVDPVQLGLFPMRFAPLVYPHADVMVRDLRKRLNKESVIVAPLFLTAEDASKIKEGREDLRTVYFVQDDERKFFHPSGERYAKREDVERSYGLTDAVFANSDWVAEMLTGLGHKPTMLPIGVDLETFVPGGVYVDGLPVVMAHSRPSTPRRGWAFMTDVFNLLALAGVDFKLVTYDEDPEGLKLGDRHDHLGKISPVQVADAMRGADVFFEGSEYQGFGMQSLESMACGCALVCTDNQGILTFGSHGRDCVIVSHGDVQHAASVIRHLLERADERRTLGVAARETATRFGWEGIADMWDVVLRELW